MNGLFLRHYYLSKAMPKYFFPILFKKMIWTKSLLRTLLYCLFKLNATLYLFLSTCRFSSNELLVPSARLKSHSQYFGFHLHLISQVGLLWASFVWMNKQVFIWYNKMQVVWPIYFGEITAARNHFVGGICHLHIL